MQILLGGHVVSLFTSEFAPDLGGHLFLAFSRDRAFDPDGRIIRGGPVDNAWGGNWGANSTDRIVMQIDVPLSSSYENPDA